MACCIVAHMPPRYCVGILLLACCRLYLMLEAAHPRPEEVVEFSSHVDVKKRAQSLMRFKSGAIFVGPARRLPMLQHIHAICLIQFQADNVCVAPWLWGRPRLGQGAGRI